MTNTTTKTAPTETDAMRAGVRWAKSRLTAGTSPAGVAAVAYEAGARWNREWRGSRRPVVLSVVNAFAEMAIETADNAQ